ncbi:uncharacterized protein LOC115890686 [Sitophilus oryzae]|uniref:Uncharacterized protein LOC115890686 n=1 Tax=Sitophilus oryzae TaxID=7048 RepID=A0A6J2YUJ4_SITOR|nr:uncharacterized protein LOC115890686 [Sitophilus oryzae]
MATNLNALESFDCEGDIGSVGLKWEKWKRAFEIYIEATNIDTPQKKRATLLHVGGLGIQEIYYNLPGAHIATSEANQDTDVYKIALESLDRYFAPKQSKLFERHVFRLLKQEPEEHFEKFLVRLRNQAAKCTFVNSEEHLIDQIVEKCHSPELRQNILTLGDSVTLDMIIIEANALEPVSRQMEKFGDKKPSYEVNKVTSRNIRSSQAPETSTSRSCYRCGIEGHLSYNCPDKESFCKKCRRKGHSTKNCRTRNEKRKHESSGPPKEFKKHKTNKSATKYEEGNVNYIFHIDQD